MVTPVSFASQADSSMDAAPTVADNVGEMALSSTEGDAMDAAAGSSQGATSNSAVRIAALQQTMNRGPFASMHPVDTSSVGPSTLGKRPARSPPSPPSIFNSRTAKETRYIARQLLELVTCPSCSRPYENPVTLPCGHATCMSCVNQRLGDIAAANTTVGSSKTSHVPPRLPLCSMTVPCSVNGCPRSAIGQGLGVWAGHTVAFGPPDAQGSLGSDDVNGQDAEDVPESAGVLPVDGFVVGAENQSLRLGVIPPQRRAKANTFALSLFPGDGGGDVTFSLRPDVTLAKAISVLQRYAQEPPGFSRQQVSPTSRARRPLRSFATARRHGDSGSSTVGPLRHNRNRSSTASLGLRQRGSAASLRGRTSSLSLRPGVTPVNAHFRSILGASEDDRESGSVAGIRAADTDDEDSENSAGSSYRRRHSRTQLRYSQADLYDAASPSREADHHGDEDEDIDDSENMEDAYDEDDNEDDFGGAFARPNGPLGYGEEAERLRQRRYRPYTLRRTSIGADDDSGWDTEHSTAEATHASTLSKADDSAMAVSSSATATQGGGNSAGSSNIEEAKMLTPEHLHSDLSDTLECQLCYLLLYEPLTTPCGHTFCRVCFARSLDHSNKCPLCRTSMPSFAFFQDHPKNQALMKLLESQVGVPENSPTAPPSKARAYDSGRDRQASPSTYPAEDLLSLSRLGVFADFHTGLDEDLATKEEEMPAISFGLRHLYQERAASVEEEEREAASWMPIFVCALAFPNMPTNLHIFEPRYRLMVRRCMQGPGPARFGMVLPSRNMESNVPGLSEYGTMLEIKSCQMLLDGRSMLETVGWKRFKLLETSSLDGYTTGRIEYIDDITPQQLAAEEAAVEHSNALARRQMSMRQRASGGQHGVDRGVPDGPRSSEDGSSIVLPPLSPPSQVGGLPGWAPPHGHWHDSQPVIQPTLADLVNRCVEFIELLRTQTAPGLFDRIVANYGPVPQPLDVEKLSWWLGMVLPIDEHAKSTLLPVRSPRKRLEMIAGWVQRIQEQWTPYT